MLHFGPVQSALSYPFSPLLLSYGPVPVERGSALVTCLSLFIHCATTTRSLSLYSRLNGQPHIEVTSRRTAPSFCFAFVNAVVIPGQERYTTLHCRTRVCYRRSLASHLCCVSIALHKYSLASPQTRLFLFRSQGTNRDARRETVIVQLLYTAREHTKRNPEPEMIF